MSFHLQYPSRIPVAFFQKKPLAALIVAGGFAVPALAQSQAIPPSGIIEEILVTGAIAASAVTTNLEQVYDLPLSQSVISGDVLDRELGLDYEAISKRLANVTFNQNNTRGASLSIRGVGKRAFAEVQDPSVLVVQDGVSFGLTALGNFDFYDVESVEGFRGPIGTWGGKGGSSGAVYINTKRPTFEPESDISITIGDREAIILKGALSGPVIEDLLAWRGSFVVDKGRGYYKNRYNANYTLYDKNRLSARVQFLLTPSENFEARLSVDTESRAPQLQNGLTFYHDQPEFYENGRPTDPTGTSARAKLDGFYSYPDLNDLSNRTWVPARDWFVGRDFNGDIYTYEDYIAGEQLEMVYFNQIEGQTVSNRGATLDLKYEFENSEFRSITAVREYTFDAHNDEGTPFDINIDGGGGVFYRQYSQEFILDGTFEDTLKYRIGAILFKTDNDITAKTGWGSDAGAWFASNAQYNTLDRNAGVNRGSGRALLRDTLDNARRQGHTFVNTQSNAIFGQLSWNWHQAAQLSAGVRVGTEDRTTADIVEIENHGSGRALNPVSVRGVNLGGFHSLTGSFTLPDSTVLPAGTLGRIVEINGVRIYVNDNTPGQLALADEVAQRYFGVPYANLTNAQKQQVSAAKAIRAAQIGQLIPYVESNYDDTLYTGFLTQSFEVADGIKVYGTWQYGEKSGTAFHINGESVGVKPEKTNAFEVGLKTILFNDTLTFNIDAFVMTIKDYQQAVRAVDDFQTQVNIDNGISEEEAIAYITAQGNVNEVKVQGVEFDAVYTGIEYLSVRVSGAYNDARYKDFKNSPKPPELNYLPDPYVDQTGTRLPGAALWTINYGAEYRRPVWNTEFHASFNTAFSSDYLNTDDLSSYSRVPAFSRTDAAIGLGRLNDGFDVSLIIKNAFDDTTHEEGWVSYSPYPYRRWVGITFSGTF